VPKFLIEKLCERYDGIVKGFGTFPSHIFVGLHNGSLREYPGEIELYLLEAKLFEDMCALFNMAKESETNLKPHKQFQSKLPLKRKEALYRATIIAAFNFLEAYLNGIAFDHLIVNKDSLDHATKKLLTEWDDANSRPHYISLRDKVVKYPRVVLGASHAPIQENNCPELEYLATKIKPLRDAIVHPTPGPDLESFEPGNEKEFFALNFSEVERIVDCAVVLVRRIERTIKGDEHRLFWLYDRSPNGVFPETVFI
jgi:hypothetical protein